jgi:hypothetical protein
MTLLRNKGEQERSEGHCRITFRFWPLGAPEAYTPEQNDIVERFFRSLKGECVWQHNFHSFTEARRMRDTLASHPATLRGGRYRFEDIVVKCNNSLGCDRSSKERKRCRTLCTFVC